jgi:glycosyltransferase involved in cell wall biosynthesis
MLRILIALNFLIFGISAFNFFTIRIPRNDQPISDSVTVLLPMRNEADNVHECVSALASQRGVKNFKVIFINDASTDRTLEFLRAATLGDSRFSIIDSPTLRQGWLGKVSALEHGFKAADSEYIITLDADVRLQPSAIARAVNQLNDLHLDFLSPYPRQRALTFSEKLIQPILHWSWMSTVVLRLAEKFPRRSTAVANGQFFVARTSSLKRVDGFTSVRHQILDDIELARSLIASGFKGVVTEGSEIANTRMYASFNEIRQGYGKSLWKAFGGPLGTVIASLFIFATGILPLILFISGYSLGFILYIYIVLTRAMSAIRSRGNPIYAFLHPLSSALLLYLIAYSWAKRGAIQWKGRTV